MPRPHRQYRCGSTAPARADDGKQQWRQPDALAKGFVWRDLRGTRCLVDLAGSERAAGDLYVRSDHVGGYRTNPAAGWTVAPVVAPAHQRKGECGLEVPRPAASPPSLFSGWTTPYPSLTWPRFSRSTSLKLGSN